MPFMDDPLAKFMMHHNILILMHLPNPGLKLKVSFEGIIPALFLSFSRRVSEFEASGSAEGLAE